MSLSQRISDLATRIGQEVKLKPSKAADEVIAGKWDMAQQGIKIGASLTAPNSGYIGFAAKADGLYQKIGAGSELRLLTTGETNLAKLDSNNTFAEVNTFLKPIISWRARFGDFPGTNLGAYISQNIVYNPTSAAWELDDIGAAGIVATLTATSPFMIRSATAGANPRTLATLLSSDISGNFTFTGTAQATRLISTIATGTAPLSVTSSTVVTNLNADLLDGKHSSAFVPRSTTSATLPAAIGWYRIATSAASINHCNGEFEIEWTLSGVHGITNINASIMYGQYPSLNMLNYSHYSTVGITKARIVYHTTYGGNYAYLEVYNSGANAILVDVSLIQNTGWTLLTPDTAGSIPAGYSTTEITFVDGIATEGQLASFVATGIAPLSVASTTAVTNLNADLLDGNHAAAFALAAHNHTGVYQPLHANLTGIAGLSVMPGLVRTDGAGGWWLDATPFVSGTPWQGEGYIKDSDFASTGLMTRTGAGTYSITPTNTYSLAAHTHAGVYQPVDADLTAIAGLAGVLGFLVKTNTNTWSLDTSTYALSTHTHAGAYEPVLGNPATNGYILSSTTAGVRSWGALPLASSTVRGGILITGGTPAPGTLPISLYNESPYVSLTSAAIEYVLTSASITSHKHDTLYAKLAGLTTQAFATANLGVTGTITITKQGDGAQLLNFTTERPWNFSQYSTGASTELRLNDSSGGKIFRIYDSVNNGNVAINNGGITASGLITAATLKLTTGAGAGKILVSDADGDATWEAPSASVPAASETASGIVEIATTAEVLAMSDMLRSLTPYTLANAFTNSSGNNGYISIPIGFGERMFIQYGSFSANGNGTVSFPLAFPLYCHSVVITAGDGIARIPSKTRFSFTWNDVADAITSANPCYWIAIGK